MFDGSTVTCCRELDCSSSSGNVNGIAAKRETKQSTKFWLNQDFTRPPAYVRNLDRNLRVCFGDACYMYIMHDARRYDELTIDTIRASTVSQYVI